MKGHKEANCWKKNLDKAPAWYKSKEEIARGAVDVEVMLCSMEVDQIMCDSGIATRVITEIQDFGLGLDLGLGL